eukprot:Rhum_TRINITY_DN10298_c0_g1::Rhum_TRINITY_DN10298_c0_g1_i1::g.37770::m.37770
MRKRAAGQRQHLLAGAADVGEGGCAARWCVGRDRRRRGSRRSSRRDVRRRICGNRRCVRRSRSRHGGRRGGRHGRCWGVRRRICGDGRRHRRRCVRRGVCRGRGRGLRHRRLHAAHPRKREALLLWREEVAVRLELEEHVAAVRRRLGHGATPGVRRLQHLGTVGRQRVHLQVVVHVGGVQQRERHLHVASCARQREAGQLQRRVGPVALRVVEGARGSRKDLVRPAPGRRRRRLRCRLRRRHRCVGQGLLVRRRVQLALPARSVALRVVRDVAGCAPVREEAGSAAAVGGRLVGAVAPPASQVRRVQAVDKLEREGPALRHRGGLREDPRRRVRHRHAHRVDPRLQRRRRHLDIRATRPAQRDRVAALRHQLPGEVKVAFQRKLAVGVQPHAAARRNVHNLVGQRARRPGRGEGRRVVQGQRHLLAAHGTQLLVLQAVHQALGGGAVPVGVGAPQQGGGGHEPGVDEVLPRQVAQEVGAHAVGVGPARGAGGRVAVVLVRDVRPPVRELVEHDGRKRVAPLRSVLGRGVEGAALEAVQVRTGSAVLGRVHERQRHDVACVLRLRLRVRRLRELQRLREV